MTPDLLQLVRNVLADLESSAVLSRSFDPILESKAFQSLLVDEPAETLKLKIVACELALFAQKLVSLKVGRGATREHMKANRARYLHAKADCATAARVLRIYARVSADAGRESELLKVAGEIERFPALASNMSGDILFDFSKVGQKGDFTGFAIMTVDAWIRPDQPNRDATIRDLLKTIGIKTSNQLVRSTRLKGRT